jgi:hypothetical protein
VAYARVSRYSFCFSSIYISSSAPKLSCFSKIQAHRVPAQYNVGPRQTMDSVQFILARRSSAAKVRYTSLHIVYLLAAPYLGVDPVPRQKISVIIYLPQQ